MEMLTVAMLIIIIYLVYYLSRRNLDYFEKLGIPYIPAKPLIGNMQIIFFAKKHISEAILETYNTFPDAKYIGMFDFIQPVIMIRDKELIKSITIKNFDSFPDHDLSIDKDIDPLFGRNLFTITGDHWRNVRTMVSPTFTSSKMKAMGDFIIHSATNFVKSLAEFPNDVRQMVDMKDLFLRFSTDAVASCAFGITIDSLKDPTNEFFVRCKDVSNFLNGKTVLKFLVARICPWLIKFCKIRFVDDDSTKFFIDIVKSSIQHREEKGINRPDMIQLLMNVKNKGGERVKLNYIDMTAQSMIFIFGLGVTTSHMSTIAHEIALNDDIQKKLQEEIDEVMSISNAKPSYEMINKLPYLDAVLNETMRRHTPQQNLSRVCAKPFVLPPSLPGGKPLTLQPGMTIRIPAGAIHRDSQYYENPDKFDPDRYHLKKVTLNDVENLGFGIGPRACIGNRFAIMEIKILLFYLLHQFNLVPNAKTCTLQKYDHKVFDVRPVGGFWLSIKSRSRIG